MELSPTWFLRTLSMKMWIITILAYFVVYLYFFLTLFVYRKCREITNQHSSIGEIFMYMWTFIASQNIESRWKKHAFWKIQVFNFSFLHIIVATGFSTFLVTLLSTKTYNMPFHELDDFATIRSHNICVWPLAASAKYFGIRTDFGTKIKALEKWKGILNEQVCDHFLKSTFLKAGKTYEDFICETRGKIAFVMKESNTADK